MLPDEPEAGGLLALMLYCEARRPARRASGGEYIPMSEQDTRLWSAPMIQEAERTLSVAARQHRAGRFQLEAALQSAHIEGARTGRPEWHGMTVLYEGLVRAAPTVGALVGRAAAIAEANGPAAGFEGLEETMRMRRGAINRTGPSVPISCTGSAVRARRSTRSIAPSA